ncbi:MAG: hypothetical protein JW913_03925 [Chitinispirillaceae bacterium]|nr:hypothetical protein [Chitinispirillaceae bacterium]
MTCKMNNQRGFAVVYGLMVLVLASMGGTALLFMTQKDRIQATDYAKMRSSSQAAKAALKACEGQFQTAPDVVLDILKDYIEDPDTKRWLLGTAENATEEQKITLGSSADAPQYSAKILGYNENDQLIMIEGTGYLNNGGKKKAIATYQLAGLAIVTHTPPPTYGLYLGGALQNINEPINIQGDVYLSLQGGLTSQHFNQGGTIKGNLKTALTNSEFNVNNALTVEGNVFMRAVVTASAAFTVKSPYKCGFENPIKTLDQQMQLKGKAFFNCSYPNNWNNSVNMNYNPVYYYTGGNPDIPTGKFANASPSPAGRATLMNLADSLGMTPGDESPYSVTMPTWASGVVKEVAGGNYSVTDVNNWWTEKYGNDKLYKDEWLIIKLNGDLAMNGNGTFYKKVIWMSNGKNINANGNWYDCDDASNTMIYVTGNTTLNGFGVPDNKRFRGYIYVDGTGNMNYQFGGDHTTFNGAIHHKQGTFNLNSPGNLNLVYNSGSTGVAAVQELMDLGIIAAPGAESLPPPGLNLVDLKIRPTLVSMQL